MFEEINLITPGIGARVLNGHQVDQSIKIIENKQLIDFVESISQMVLILNKQQQIVYANKSYREFFNSFETKKIVGLRPGDTFKCRNALSSKYGCGTTKFCKSCGAANAIIEAVSGNRSTRECKIQTIQNETIDLRVTASPLCIDEEELTLFSIIDISHEKRRRSLERIFIHDILNIAGGISGLSAILKEIEDPKEMREVADTIEVAAQNLIEEIQTQREIGSAERGDLTLHYTEVQTLEVLNELKNLYSNHDTNKGKPIIVHGNENHCILTDRTLLKRILGNMVKNAVEAIEPNDKISIGCTGLGNKVRFHVHNNSVIPEEIKSELFKRFYSTKQIGRGIGTYSMKLFGEKYLKGKVWFSSSPEKGTNFYIELNY